MGRDRFIHTLPRWILFITWGVVIFWFSLIPSPPVPKMGFMGWDKFQHAASYGLLTFLGGLVFPLYSTSRIRGWVLAAVVAVVVGILVELAQGVFTAARTAEAGDLLADCLGAAAVVLLVMAVNGRSKAKS